MNLNKLLFKLISEKIKDYRENILKKNQSDFIAYIQTKGTHIDRSQLSRIENGRADPHKNPNLMSSSQIEDFSKIMNISKKELIFGSENEVRDVVKLILLNLLINDSDINPFFDVESENNYEFFKKANYNISESELNNLNMKKSEIFEIQLNLELLDKKVLKRYKDVLSSELYNFDNFFFNSSNFKLYELVTEEFKKNYEYNSNLLLKLLYSDLKFASDFLTRQTNYIHSYNEENKTFFEHHTDNTGNFAKYIINEKEDSYKIFVNAFNEMYRRNFKIFIDFFNEKLFNKINDMNTNYMSIVKNNNINDLLSSPELSQLLNKIYLEEQMNPDTFLGHHYIKNAFMTDLIEVNNKQKEYNKGKKYGDYELFYDTRNLVEYFIHQDKRDGIMLFVNKFN